MHPLVSELLTQTGDEGTPQLYYLLVVLCAVYSVMALAGMIAFGLHIRRAGCVLSRHAVFFFLLILTLSSTLSVPGSCSNPSAARIVSFGVNASNISYDPAAFHFAEMLPELLFFVAFALVLLEWYRVVAIGNGINTE